MQWLEKLLPSFTSTPAKPRPQPMMQRFEMAGLHELGTCVEFKKDTAGRAMALFFGSLAVFVVVALWVATFSKQEAVRGVVLGNKGSQRILSTVDGTVTKIWVKNGEKVRVGQRLITIAPQQVAVGDKPLSEALVSTLIAQKENTLRQIEQIGQMLSHEVSDRSVYDSSLERLSDNLRSQEKEIKAAIDEGEENLNKLRAFLKQGFVTRASVLSEERSVQDYKRQLSSIQIELSQIEEKRTSRRRSLEQNENLNNNQLSDLKRLLLDLETRILQARSGIATDIIAEIDGQMAALNVQEGATVETGDIIAAIGNPDAPFTIGLEVPSKAIGLVGPGQRVVLKYDAFPYKTFGVKYGTVVSVAKQPLKLPKEAQQALPISPGLAAAAKRPPPQSKFLVEVEPESRTISAYGTERPILVGSTLTADIVVEKRRLIDWVLDPIFALKGRS